MKLLTMFECPICGKDSNRKGKPFTSKEPVVSHIDGSHDPDHKGVSGEEMRDQITEVESPSRSTDPDAGGVNGRGEQKDSPDSSADSRAGSGTSETAKQSSNGSDGAETSSDSDGRDASEQDSDGGGGIDVLQAVVLLAVGLIFVWEQVEAFLFGSSNDPEIV